MSNIKRYVNFEFPVRQEYSELHVDAIENLLAIFGKEISRNSNASSKVNISKDLAKGVLRHSKIFIEINLPAKKS